MAAETQTPPAAQPRLWMKVVVCAGALIAIGLVAMKFLMPGQEGEAPEVALAPYDSPDLDGYVGDQACSACHQEIAEFYTSHPMSRSITLVDAGDPEGLLPGEQTRVLGRERFFEVDVHNQRMRHHEKMLDGDGDLIYDHAVEMDYVIGSGQDARAFMYHRGSLMFMSPLNWFSAKQVWDLSPGYVPDDRRRFDRQINDECLSCHAGRVDSLGQDQFPKPAFHQMAIGCENCHGPGRDHIRFREGEMSADISADPIVNPAKLKPELRESVCNQCHHLAAARVLRHGRSSFDFRPGQHVEEIWTFLDEPSQLNSEGRVTAVSHVQQMRQSRCFSASDGKFGCISCHDPHRRPSKDERLAFYRKRCLNCHHDDDCLSPNEARQAENDSCIACHMPAGDAGNISHISQTDHRIIRSPGEAAASGSKVAELALPKRAEESLPKWERERAFLIGNWQHRSHQGLPPDQDILDRLVVLSRNGPEDRAILDALSLSWIQRRVPRTARRYLQRQLKIPGAEFSAMTNLLTIEYEAAQFEQALEYADRLLKFDPGAAGVLAVRADILLNLDRHDEAIESAELALVQNPTLKPVRMWLITQLGLAGREDEQKKHESILKRMESASLPKP